MGWQGGEVLIGVRGGLGLEDQGGGIFGGQVGFIALLGGGADHLVVEDELGLVG